MERNTGQTVIKYTSVKEMTKLLLCLPEEKIEEIIKALKEYQEENFEEQLDITESVE